MRHLIGLMLAVCGLGCLLTAFIAQVPRWVRMFALVLTCLLLLPDLLEVAAGGEMTGRQSLRRPRRARGLGEKFDAFSMCPMPSPSIFLISLRSAVRRGIHSGLCARSTMKWPRRTCAASTHVSLSASPPTPLTDEAARTRPPCCVRFFPAPRPPHRPERLAPLGSQRNPPEPVTRLTTGHQVAASVGREPREYASGERQRL
jgi:hypothetical protein